LVADALALAVGAPGAVRHPERQAFLERVIEEIQVAAPTWISTPGWSGRPRPCSRGSPMPGMEPAGPWRARAARLLTGNDATLSQPLRVRPS